MDEPEQDQQPPTEAPRGLASKGASSGSTSRYSVYVGLAFVALAIIALINTLATEEGGIAGVGETPAGAPLAEFAVPELLGPLDGDANVFGDDCESSANPCPPDDVRIPACEIEEPGSLRVCDLFDRPLAISFWFTRGGDCIPSQEAFDAVARRYRDRANFLSINVRDERAEAREIAESLDWTVPIGHDRDGAVSNIYRVGVCPTIVLARPGGILDSEAIKPGNFSEGEITELVDGLLERSDRG